MEHPDNIKRAVHLALRSEVGELPPAPAAAVKLLSLTRGEDTEVSSISRVIETEPALAAKVLQIVNSAFYGFPSRITSIHRAVTLLGFSAVRQVALQVLFYEGLVKRGGKGAFDRLHFWQHSLLVAILSRGIGARLGHPDPDSLYAAGLLHDLGKIILESHGRVRYSDFLAASSNSMHSIRDNERTYFGVTHDAVGAVICESWGLPELVCRVQALHHRSIAEAKLPHEEAREVAIVSLADFIAWTQGIGSVEMPNSPSISREALSLVPLEQLGLPELFEQADREITEIGTFYGLEFPSSPELRANMIATAIALCQGEPGPQTTAAGNAHSSYTAPHQSLNPDEFIPQTLEALRRELGVGRLLMMQVERRRRSLVATHALPPMPAFSPSAPLEMTITSLSGDLVRCLRERRPVLVREAIENEKILSALGVCEAAAVPVMCHGRLLGVLWVSPKEAGQPLEIAPLSEVMRVAGELGIAIERSRAFERERAKAEVDALTRLSNRSAIDRFLAQAFRQGKEAHRRFAVGLADIDHFKRFNDTFGHQTGDDVLRIVADTMRSLTRPTDFLGRYGGEEFLFVLMDSNGEGARIYAERIRRHIEQRGQILGERFPGHPLTVSIGLALHEDQDEDPAQIVGAADAALYRAKAAGRNRIEVAWAG
ncbi:HDOD domain-containing protein [Thiocystis violacea]|uniref:HDOD domain-containing protein n=1 Tax=Thiocystis violacea TaxID=13725 RepID=UPI0019054C9F|nr:diguanylate cyclase [Thiocystis violacea]